MKRVVTLICLFAFCAVLANSAVAQNVSGGLTGTVLDPDGKAVAGATVTVTDAVTNASQPAAKTGSDGRYVVANLPPGNYTVTITAANFKTSITNNIEIITGKVYDLPTKMELGASSVTVEVTAGGQQNLETQNTSTAQTISGRAIVNLPLTSHSALLLAVLDPGAQSVGGPRNTSFEGLPKGAINVTFDGINAQDNVLKSSDGFFANNDPRIDDVEEFGITTTGNDPKNSGQGAVQMSYVSKRGGNAFHGGVWEYNRNTALDSNYYFSNLNGISRQIVQLNDFGYKVGGPILKDKLFFFTDFDFFQFPQSLARSRTLYNAQAAAGIFNYTTNSPSTASNAFATCAPISATQSNCAANLFTMANSFIDPNTGVAYPHAVNGVVAPILTAVESSTSAPGVTIGAAPSPYQTSINYNASTMQTRRYPDIRLDYNVAKNHSIEFDYHYAHFNAGPDVLNNRDTTFPVAPFNTSVGAQLSNRNLFVTAWRWTIGNNKSNELRVGVQAAPINFGLGINNGFFPTVNTNVGTATPVAFALSGVSTVFQPLSATQGRNAALGELHDTFSWTTGNHQFTYGVDFTQIHYNDFFNFNATVGFGINTNDPAAGNLFASGNLPGISSTDLAAAEGLYASLTGRVTSFASQLNFNPATRQYQTGQKQQDLVGQNEIGFYGGDSWRMRPNLTVNLGLRWEYSGPPYDKDNEYFMVQNPNDVFGISGPGNLFHPGATAGNSNIFFQNDQGKSWYNKYYKAFAPSVGFAWQPNSDNSVLKHLLGGPGKTVIRSAYAIAYSREGLNSFFGIAQGNPGLNGSQFSNAAISSNLANGQFQAGTILLGQPVNFVAQNPTTFSSFFPLSPTSGASVNAFVPGLKPPTVQSWNFGIQRELSSNLVLEISYRGNHGTGLTDQFNMNEVNIFENNFLPEFNNAVNNLSVCVANATACKAAQGAAGVSAGNQTANSFADWGLAGQTALPIMTAAFNAGLTPATLPAASAAGSLQQTSSLFRNSTLITELNARGAGSFANSIGTGSSNFSSFLTNLVSAGFPSNFFVVNPAATGGSFITTNGANSSYNALVVDLRHRMTHGLQFDINYAWSKSLTNYNANSSLNFFGFTTLRNTEYDKGPAPFDIAHAIKAQLIYQLPFGSGHRWSSSNGFVDRIIGGWEVDSVTRFQTGQAISITSGVSGGNTFNNNAPGINLVGLTRQQLQSMLTTNKTEFTSIGVKAVGYVPTSLLDSSLQKANTAILQPCNVAGQLCGKPFVFGPNFFRADISITKTTKITERVNFEMRAELLNAFNDADFYYAAGPGTSPASISTQSTRFGQMGSNSSNGAYSDINTTQDPGGRIIQLVGRINF